MMTDGANTDGKNSEFIIDEQFKPYMNEFNNKHGVKDNDH